MTTVVDLLSSIKEEVLARYKSPFWGAALLALLCAHWKIVIFFMLDKPSSSEAIEFVLLNSSWISIGGAIGFALCYVVLFPWFEYFLSKFASSGLRSRNGFQVREREKEVTLRKLVAQQEADAAEIELKGKINQSRLSDVDLVKSYQQILSGENFTRWLRDAKLGAINTNLHNVIVNYLNKVDSLDGKFVDSAIESAHAEFVSSISFLLSILDDGRNIGDETKILKLTNAVETAHAALQNYRKVVRETLEI